MNELDLLQVGLGNGTYYVVAEGSQDRTTQSNNVEVNDIVPTFEVSKITVLEESYAIEVYVTAKDLPYEDGSVNIVAVLGSNDGGAISAAIQLYGDDSLPTVSYQRSISSYKLTIARNKLNTHIESSGTLGFNLVIGILDTRLSLKQFMSYSPKKIVGLTTNAEFYSKFSIGQPTYNKTTNKITWKTNISQDSVDEFTLLEGNDYDEYPATFTIENGELSAELQKDYVGRFSLGITLSPYGIMSYAKFHKSVEGVAFFVWFYLAYNDESYKAAIQNEINPALAVQSSVSVNPTLDPPILTYAASDRKLQWESVEGALSYGVYKNGKRVGTVQDGKFTPAPSAAAEIIATREVYDTDRNVVGYITSDGKFKKSSKIIGPKQTND